MNRRRTSDKSLTSTRIYVRHGSYWFFSPEPILDPKTGKVARWHKLCKASEGELSARTLLAQLLGTEPAAAPKGTGDFCAWWGKWRGEIIAKRKADEPQDAARKEIWEKGSKALGNVLGVIENAFADFDIHQIMPSHVATFVDQWQGRRAAQLYRGHLSKFFAWCCRRGILEKNPAREVTVEAPQKRDVYFEHSHYIAIHQLLDSGSHNQRMCAIYMDLLYLFHQRGTDVRLLKRDQVQGDSILFRPTKTERSSGVRVKVPITEEARQVIDKAKTIAQIQSIYLLSNEQGQPFDARYLGDTFKAACKKLEIEGITLKDLRAKAATDAKQAGYSQEQLQTALAHTDGSTTRGYIRSREVPVSEVILKLPK